MKRERKPGHILMRDGRLISEEEWRLRWGKKHKRRKLQYMRYFHHWVGKSQYTKLRSAREQRREAKRYGRI